MDDQTLKQAVLNWDKVQFDNHDLVFDSKAVINQLNEVLPEIYNRSATLQDDWVTASTDWDALDVNSVYFFNSLAGNAAPDSTMLKETELGMVITLRNEQRYATVQWVIPTSVSGTNIAFRLGDYDLSGAHWQYIPTQEYIDNHFKELLENIHEEADLTVNDQDKQNIVDSVTKGIEGVYATVEDAADIRSLATTAQSAASQAQSAANVAQSAATKAQNTADSATTAAVKAQTSADTAQSTGTAAGTAAKAAQSTADTAKTNAATAQTTANAAKTAAATAQSAADSAKSNSLGRNPATGDTTQSANFSSTGTNKLTVDAHPVIPIVMCASEDDAKTKSAADPNTLYVYPET